MDTKTIDDFYKEASAFLNADPSQIMPEGIDKEIGHFNVIDIAAVLKMMKVRPAIKMSYNRRSYYKINLVDGKKHR
jgi:AraC family transcriptional activator of pobA